MSKGAICSTRLISIRNLGAMDVYSNKYDRLGNLALSIGRGACR
jgi:hypothetical protein